MRIAYVCSDFSIPIHGLGAAAVRVRELSRALQRLGHDVAIFSPRSGGPAPPGFAVEVCEVGLEAPERHVFDLLADDRAAGEAAARDVRALLHAAALRYRLHGILGVFRPDAVYERYSLLGSGGLSLARGLGVPLILEVNGPLAAVPGTPGAPAFGQTARALERTILREADRVVVASRRLSGTVEELGVAPERVAILPDGVDAERFAAAGADREAVRAGLGFGPADPVVGLVGGLRAWHGPATLVRAVAGLLGSAPALRLLLVGDGPARPGLEALARAEGLGAAAVYTGAVPHERVPGLLAAMDIVVAPYDRADGLHRSPLALHEAMAAGRPVVAAAAGPGAEAVRDGATGLLYSPGDAAALAAALAALLADRARAAALGRAAIADVRAGRTWLGQAAALVELVGQVRRPRPAEPIARAASD